MRLIDADALLEKMKRRWERFGRESDCICLIEDAPTIDAVPVRHGKWVDNGFTLHKCSICGFEDGFCKPSNYCPNCGAKMGKEKADDDS